MVDFYINSECTDISNEDKIALTIQAFDITMVDSIVTSFTRTIKLPLTARNMRIFKNAHLINANCEIVHDKINCKLVIDSIEVITSGYAYIIEINEYFNINVFFSAFLLFEELEDKTLNDLDLADLNHYWNKDNILKLTSPPLTDEIQYPLIEWGVQILDDSDDPKTFDVNLEAMLPVVSCNRILNQIIEDAGYTLGNTLSIASIFNKLFLAVANIKADEVTNNDVENTYADIQEVGQYDYWYAMNHLPQMAWDYNGTFYRFGAINFENIVETFFHQLDIMPAVNERTEQWLRFRVTTTGKIRFHAHVKFSTPVIGPGYDEDFIVYVSIALITSSTGNFYDTDENGKGPTYSKLGSAEEVRYYRDIAEWKGERDYADVIIEESFSPGDLICVVIENLYRDDGEYGSYAAFIADESYFEVVDDACAITEIGYGYWWNIPLNLPEMSQIEFIKGIFQLYNLVITKDLTRNIVYIKRFDEVFNNIYQARDWTDRIVESKKPLINYIPEGFAKKNWFKYQEIVGDEADKLDFNYSFNINNAMLSKETDIITSVFLPVPSVIRTMINLNVPQITLINLGYQLSGGTSPVILYVDTTESLGNKSLYYKSVIEDYNYITIGTNYVKAWFEDIDDIEGHDLSWESLAGDYYQKYISILQNFKSITVPVKLYLNEIQNFDFSIPVYIKQYSSYFYVNVIKDYLNGFATVQLIKLY